MAYWNDHKENDFSIPKPLVMLLSISYCRVHGQLRAEQDQVPSQIPFGSWLITELDLDVAIAERLPPAFIWIHGISRRCTWLFPPHGNSWVPKLPAWGRAVFHNAEAEGRQKIFLEVLIHESIHNRVANRIEEPYDLDNCKDHFDCHIIILLLKITWRGKEKHSVSTECYKCLLLSQFISSCSISNWVSSTR